MEATISLRALMKKYRKAAAAYDAAKAKADAWQEAYDHEEMVRKMDGRGPMPDEEREASNRLWDDLGDRFDTPLSTARDQLGAAVRVAFGLNPYGKFDRSRAVVIDGSVVVTVDRGDDSNLRTCLVIEAADVLGMPEVIEPLGGPSDRRRQRERDRAAEAATELKPTPKH